MHPQVIASSVERNQLKSIGSDMFLWTFHYHLVHLIQPLKYQIYTKFNIHLSDLEVKLTFGVSNYSTAQYGSQEFRVDIYIEIH